MINILAKNYKNQPEQLHKTYARCSLNNITSSWKPPLDIYEDTKMFTVTMEIPGIDDSNLSVIVDDNNVTVKGIKTPGNQFRSQTRSSFERGYGNFERTFSLPVHINQDRILSMYKNGVLTLTIPKERESTPQPIRVNFIN